MSADKWNDRANGGVRLVNPTWDQIRQAIAALDGEQKTVVGISDKEGSDHYMLVAGQWDGRCLVNTTKDNLDFFSLVDSSRSSDKRMLYVGGQNGQYEERKCVPADWALEAAQHFFETGEMKPAMNWVSDY